MTRRPNPLARFRQFAAGVTDPGTSLLATRRPNPARCRHRRDMFVKSDTMSGHVVRSRQCWDCPTWLPLGPANDAPPEVQQEIRAAEIAADGSLPIFVEQIEALGWNDWHRGDYVGTHGVNAPAWHAGFLARAIVEHEEES